MSRPFVTENVFRALSHSRRMRVLTLLRKNDLRPAELSQTIGLSGPALSLHLRTLRQSGLISSRRQGTTLVYRLNRSALRDAAGFLSSLAH